MRKMIKIMKGNSCHYSVAKTEPLVPIDIMAYYPYACVNPRATWPKRVFVSRIFVIDGILRMFLQINCPHILTNISLYFPV